MTIGQGDVGQLGLGEDIVERKKPFTVCGALEGKKVVQVVCGGMHTVALTDDGQVCVCVCVCMCNREGKRQAHGLIFSSGIHMGL